MVNKCAKIMKIIKYLVIKVHVRFNHVPDVSSGMMVSGHKWARWHECIPYWLWNRMRLFYFPRIVSQFGTLVDYIKNNVLPLPLKTDLLVFF